MRIRRCTPVCVICLTALSPATRAQQVADSPVSVAALVSDAVAAQQADMGREGWALRYRVRRVDSKENTVRDLVETSGGHVARTVERDGRPLSPDQQAAEIERLQALRRTGVRHRSSDSLDRHAAELVAAMPSAMEYMLVPGQPQLRQSSSKQIVLDYYPRTGFQPASAAQSLLKGLSGRLWIDAETHHLLRIEVNVKDDLDIALGLLARVYRGGTLTYEQEPVGGGHDAYTSIEVNVRLRELMVHTAPYHLRLETSNRTLLPKVPALDEGVAMLLAK